MPRVSLKRRLEIALERASHEAEVFQAAANNEDSDFDSVEDLDAKEDDNALFGDLLNECSSLVSTKRYIFPRVYRKRNDKWLEILDEDLGYYNDREFLTAFRVTRSSFWKLVYLIRYHNVFNRRQRPVEAQLMAFLYVYGTEDQNYEKIGRILGFSSGSVRMYRKRVTTAIRAIKDDVIYWPDEAERDQIARRIWIEYKFPHCVGIIDGTLLFLESKPEYFGEDFNTRKGGYAVNTLIVCDDMARILYYVCGWAGSAHDNRVWRNSHMHCNPDDYFSNTQYILADSAFTASPFVIPAFKRNSGEAVMVAGKEWFNTQLAKPRVKSEHCNAMLKGRFPLLTRMSVQISEGRHVKKVVDTFECCAILHNLLLEYGDEGDLDWYEEVFDDVGGYTGENDDVNEAIPDNAPGTERRTRIYYNMLEQHNMRLDD